MVATLMNYIYPGATVPQNWFSTKGFSFPTGSPISPGAGGGGTAGGGGGGGGGGAIPGLDATTQALLGPMLGGSTFLQNMFANNPTAITSAASPAAASQLAGMYPPGTLPGIGGGNQTG